MILAIDIGNSNINIGGYQGKTLRFVARLRTDTSRTECEYAVTIKSLLELYHADHEQIEGAILSSVVPPLTSVIRDAVAMIRPVKAMVVGPGIKTGLNIRIDNPGELGADLLCTAIGAMEKYPLPVVIIDMGTATKITVVDQHKSFLGGAIMPGVMIGLDALSSGTAQLPHISLSGDVKRAIGSNTVDCMRSGVLLGAASMIDGMVARYQAELDGKATVVACGGLMAAVVPHCTCRLERDETLLLDGLRVLYEKNVGD